MKRHLTYLLSVMTLLFVAACASIGNPEGGPRDYQPPHIRSAKPPYGITNFQGDKIEITFDEYIALNDQQKKVVVSPPCLTAPSIAAQGKKVVVQFREPLQENTTYTIDFSNSIADNNEGNTLKGYSYTFSTGETIDTLQMSGIVLRAKDLEPMQYVLVGIHSNLDDTAFTRQPFERVCRTNDRGQFTLRNVKPGSYHIFALNDIDGNYHMARTEDIAFVDSVYVPSCHAFISNDTTFTFDRKVDTVVTAEHIRYMPNNVLLCMFNEDYRSQYLKTFARPADNRLHVLFGAPSDTLPQLTLLKPSAHADDWYRLERSERNDSLFYWLTDSALIKSDTIIAQMRYLATDTADRLAWKTDTVTFAFRKSNSQIKQEKEEAKAREEEQKRLGKLLEKKAKADADGKALDEGEIDEIKELTRNLEPKTELLKVEWLRSGTIDIGDTAIVHFETPIANIDPTKIHLEEKRDTLWFPISAPAMRPVSDTRMFDVMLPYSFEPGGSYRLTLDSLAVTSIYGISNGPDSKELTVRNTEEYANLFVTVNAPDGSLVELLQKGEKVRRTATVSKGAVEMLNVTPETYYLRLTIDSNHNGKWDTGNYANHLQPEEVYYYPKKLKLRKNWDVEENWNIYEVALDLQKPEDLRINKPEQEKNAVEQKKKATGEDEDDEDDSSGVDPYTGNKYTDTKNKQLKSR